MINNEFNVKFNDIERQVLIENINTLARLTILISDTVNPSNRLLLEQVNQCLVDLIEMIDQREPCRTIDITLTLEKPIWG